MSLRDLHSVKNIIHPQFSQWQTCQLYTLNQRVKDSSRVTYRGKLNTIKVRLMQLEVESNQHFQLVNEQGDIIIPLPHDIIVNVFEWISTNTSLPRLSRSFKKKQMFQASAAAKKTALNNSICDEEDNGIESEDEFQEDNLEPVTPDNLAICFKSGHS